MLVWMVAPIFVSVPSSRSADMVEPVAVRAGCAAIAVLARMVGAASVGAAVPDSAALASTALAGRGQLLARL